MEPLTYETIELAINFLGLLIAAIDLYLTLEDRLNGSSKGSKK